MRNERGYTLVITLLMITLIFIVSVTFIATSLNSAKQNKQTSSRYLATQIAEMGIVYVEESLKGNIPKDETDVDKVWEIVDNTINGIVGSGDKTIDPEKSNRFFTIKDNELTRNENTITLSFLSEGAADDKKAPLEATLMIVVPLDDSAAGGGGMINIGEINDLIGGLPSEYQESVPSSWFGLSGGKAYVYHKDSVFPQFGISNDNTLIVTGNATFNGSIDTQKNFLLAVYGDADFNSNISPTENTRILIAGLVNAETITLGGNSLFLANGFKTDTNVDLGNGTQFIVCSNSTFNTVTTNPDNHINICDTATFKSNINFNSFVTMNVKNNATFNGFTLNNSKITVGNNLTINEPWSNHNNNSTIRVFGDLFLNTGLNTDHTGQTIVYGDMHIKNSRWQSLGQHDNKKICVRGNIHVPSSWGSDDRKILTEKSDATSCESLPNGIYYNMKSLVVPDKNDYFQDCTESCVLNDKNNKIDIDLEKVTY